MFRNQRDAVGFGVEQTVKVFVRHLRHGALTERSVVAEGADDVGKMANGKIGSGHCGPPQTFTSSCRNSDARSPILLAIWIPSSWPYFARNFSIGITALAMARW